MPDPVIRPKVASMRELHYIDGILVVDDEVCLAVFRYAVALAASGGADLVTIPILWEETRQTANLVLGPGSQLFCTPTSVDAGGVDLTDGDLVDELTGRSRRIGSRTAVPLDADSQDGPDVYVDDM